MLSLCHSKQTLCYGERRSGCAVPLRVESSQERDWTRVPCTNGRFLPLGSQGNPSAAFFPVCCCCCLDNFYWSIIKITSLPWFLSSIQLLSCVQLFATPMDCSMPGLPVHHHLPELLKLMSITSVMPSDPLILCHPLLLLSAILLCIIVFSKESVLWIRWPKYWSFSFSISPYNEYSGLISFRMDWFDLFAVQGTLKSLIQHHSAKASVLWRSAFFMVQLSHLYMSTGKTKAFVGKVMSLLFNICVGWS